VPGLAFKLVIERPDGSVELSASHIRCWARRSG
jgi:hypothetical protein